MATEAIDLDLRELPPYSAVLWSQFEQNPRIMYNLFEPTGIPEKSYQSNKVFDMSGAKYNPKLSELKVDNAEELHRLTRDLLRMPILFRVKVEHERTDHYIVMKVRRKWRDEFAILVNTQHPQIREILTHRLTEAMQYLTEGKKFCIKIGFGPSVRQWYSGIVDSQVTVCDSRANSDDGNMSIYIHNYSTPIDCCMHPLCILCCFPFWLICGGPCYFINRKRKCIDVKDDVRDLPVVMLTGQHTLIIQDHVQGPPATGNQYPSQSSYYPNELAQYPQYNPQYGGAPGPYTSQQVGQYGGPPAPYTSQQVGQYGGSEVPKPPPYSP